MSQPGLNTVPGIELPDLTELDLPLSVSMFPQTLAWKVVLVLALVTVLLLVLLTYRRYVRLRWQRQALALAMAAQRSALIDDWFVLIKRVCLVHQPRAHVAALSDSALLAQLTQLDGDTRKAMVEGHHQRHERLSTPMNTAVAKAFTHWLKELADAR